ncbi:MAG TPA: cytosine permease [Vicinamibacteria bacterium]|nr:cytosine permease [Vicinamibacteria bacterium]
MQAADLGPVPAEARTQSPLDLFLIFVGANIVATTLVTGASLVPAFSAAEVLALIALGTVVGSALVAALAPVGPRLGVPSVVAMRAAVGFRGAMALAVLLYVTNFAWIALNNVIAASACARVWGGPASEKAWAIGLGLLATAVVAAGPRAVGHADRVAVPLMAVTGLVFAWRAAGLPAEVWRAPGTHAMSWWRGLDVVVAYQVSWILMFADYSRYTASARKGVLAVFLGLALSSLWFMPLGALAARAAGSSDPGAMVDALHLGVSGALLVALGTITTNFVNIYLSALAWKSLVPRASDAASVWSIGIVGAALSLLSRSWLDGYADLMIVLGALLVPVGGILLARFVLERRPVDAAALYDRAGPYGSGRFAAAATAWTLGAITYFAAERIGGTLPALLVAGVSYRALTTRAT